MNSKVIVLVLFLGLAAAAPNNEGKSLLTRMRRASTSYDNRLGMYQGNRTTIENHKYMVSIQLNGKSQCPGTIVSESYVLTLATCAVWRSVDGLTVLAGSDDHVHGTTYTVKSFQNHSQAGTYSHNFALLQIEGFFNWSSTVGQVSLPSSPPRPYKFFTAVGWGPIDEYGLDEDSLALYQGQVQLLMLKACKYDYPTYAWDNSMGCIMIWSRMELCIEDYGDPIVSGNTIFGLMMFDGMPGVVCTYPVGVAFIANIYPVVGWIKGIING